MLYCSIYVVEFRQKPIYKVHTAVRFSPAEYEQARGGAENIEWVQFSEMVDVALTIYWLLAEQKYKCTDEKLERLWYENENSA